MSEPGENAIRLDWRLEEQRRRARKRRREWENGEWRFGERRDEGRNIKALSELGPRLWAKIQWNTVQNLGLAVWENNVRLRIRCFLKQSRTRGRLLNLFTRQKLNSMH